MECKEKIRWRYSGSEVVVVFEEAFRVKEKREVTVSYKVEKPVLGVLYGGEEEKYSNLPLFFATDNETEKAEYWLPCVNRPSVRTTVNWRVRHEKRFTCLCNGEEEGVIDHQDGTQTTKWSLDYPCPSYLLCFVGLSAFHLFLTPLFSTSSIFRMKKKVGEYVRFDEPKESCRIPVSYFGLKGTKAEDLKQSFGEAPKMIEWIEKKLGSQVPWKKYFQVVVPTHESAMENISLVILSSKFYENGLTKTKTCTGDMVSRIFDEREVSFGSF